MNRYKRIVELLEVTNVFLTGGAGVGKTTLTNEVITYFEQTGRKVARLASTGIAATLLGGQTLHSFFDLGIASTLRDLEYRKKLSLPKRIKKILSSIDLVVIDEISTVSADLLEMVRYRLLQADVKVRLLVVGDFLQLPPITKGNVNFAFESKAWERFNFATVMLEDVYRTDDEAFIKLLSQVRFGRIDKKVQEKLGEFIKPIPDDVREFTFLFGKNASVSLHNKMQLDYIQNDLIVKDARVEIYDKNVKEQEIERFFKETGIEKRLYLKIGVPVLFTRNAWNYYNGERGIVVDVDEQTVYIRKNNGAIVRLVPQKQAKTVWIENGLGEIEEKELFGIFQYPIKLAFAITIHKSQGMSLENIIIESNEIFAPSQFYVALSRTKDPSRLNLIPPKRNWKTIIYTHQKAVKFYEERKWGFYR